MGSLYESMGGVGGGPSWWERNVGTIITVVIIVLFLGSLVWFLTATDKQIEESFALSTKVISTTPVGEIESITVQQGNWSTSTTTTINTTKGTFVVYGRFSFLKGAKARMETRGNNSKYICISGMSSCNRMAQ